MTQEALQQFSLETLLDLLVISTKALLDAKENNEGNDVIIGKLKIIQSIKKAIAAKRDATLPGFTSTY